jgi:hypothetical protein
VNKHTHRTKGDGRTTQKYWVKIDLKWASNYVASENVLLFFITFSFLSSSEEIWWWQEGKIPLKEKEILTFLRASLGAFVEEGGCLCRRCCFCIVHIRSRHECVLPFFFVCVCLDYDCETHDRDSLSKMNAENPDLHIMNEKSCLNRNIGSYNYQLSISIRKLYQPNYSHR